MHPASKLLALLAVATPLVLVPGSRAADRDAPQARAPVAQPSALTAAIAHPEIAYDLARTGIEWNHGLDAALHRGKPVLLFQLLGDFSTVHC